MVMTALETVCLILFYCFFLTAICITCAGVELDSEEALKWLSKAIKSILAVNSFTQIKVEAVVPKVPLQAPSQEEDPVCFDPPPPPISRFVSEAVSSVVPVGLEPVLLQMLARSAVVVGYLFHDGEGTKADPSEAVRLFRLAAACGSREGERVLGWLWNTGQF